METKEGESTVVTEDNLQKTLDGLEGKAKPEEKPTGTPKVETAQLQKTAKEAIAEAEVPNLKKAIEVSSGLKEFSETMGAHIDASLQTLQKTIDAGAQRDLTMATILGNLSKALTSLEAKMEAFGEQPTKPKAIVTSTDMVLEKTADKNAGAPKMTKQDVSATLMKLAKTGDDADMNRFAFAVTKFETSGHISDSDLAAVIAERKAA